MDSRVLDVRTGGREAVHDLTRECEQFLAGIGAGDGLLHVWVPHATAGLAVLETGAGSDDDLLAALRELLPAGRPLAAPARIARPRPGPRAAGAVPAVRLGAVVEGRMALGTWQSVCLVDLNGDNPLRQVRLSFLSQVDGGSVGTACVRGPGTCGLPAKNPAAWPARRTANGPEGGTG